MPSSSQLPTLDLSALGTLPAGSAAVPRLDDGMAELSSEVVDQYIAQLRAVGVRGAGAPEAEVKAAVGDEPLTLEAAEPALDEAARKEYNQLLAAAEPQLGALAFDLDAQVRRGARSNIGCSPASEQGSGRVLDNEKMSWVQLHAGGCRGGRVWRARRGRGRRPGARAAPAGGV